MAKDITRMLQISGIQYTWDANKPNGEKVTSMRLTNGEEIIPSKLIASLRTHF